MNEEENDDDVEDSKEGEGEEEMMLEDDDPDNPANSKPKVQLVELDFLSVALAGNPSYAVSKRVNACKRPKS